MAVALIIFQELDVDDFADERVARFFVCLLALGKCELRAERSEVADGHKAFGAAEDVALHAAEVGTRDDALQTRANLATCRLLVVDAQCAACLQVLCRIVCGCGSGPQR